MKKYYYPDEEEFSIGFTYDSLQDERFPEADSSWQTNTIENEWDLRTFIGYYCGDHIAGLRVKYLDPSDMKELGWLFCNIDDYGCDVFSKNIETGVNTGVLFYAYISSSNPGKIFLKWESYSSYGFESGQIGMYIKNKFEFETFFNKLSIG